MATIHFGEGNMGVAQQLNVIDSSDGKTDKSHPRVQWTASRIPVELSIRLWRSLLWPYPGSRPLDIIDTNHLLGEFGLRVRLKRLPPSSERLFYPSQVPDWLERGFALRIISDSARHRVLDLNPAGGDEHAAELVPAGLLVRVLRSIESLWDHMRRCDLKHLRSIHATVHLPVARHPLAHFIRGSVQGWGYSRSQLSYLTTEEYRGIMLRDLSEGIELLGVCGADRALMNELLESLAQLRSPISELLHITQSLMRVAGAVPEQHRLDSPIDGLLCYYQGLRRLYAKKETEVPKLLLPRLVHFCQVLSDLTGESQVRPLRVIRRRLEVLTVLEAMSSDFGIYSQPGTSLH